MSLSVIAQVASAVTNVLFVVVIAVGYFMMTRLYRQMVAVYDRMLGLMETQSTSMGRPLGRRRAVRSTKKGKGQPVRHSWGK